MATQDSFVSFSWNNLDHDLLEHLKRMLATEWASYEAAQETYGWRLSGKASPSAVKRCETFQEDWEVHKPETVKYSFNRRDVDIFRRALGNIFPHASVYKPFFGMKGSVELYGARSEHKRFQERLLEEQVEAVFSKGY